MTEQDKTIDALTTALQMEIDGKEFYLKASESSQNTLGKELLQSLAEEEDTHRRKFEEIYEAVRSRNEWPSISYEPDGGKRLKTILATATGSMDSEVTAATSELDAVKTAMTMENNTYDFYVARSQATAYGAERDFYRALSAQEKAHHAVLLDYYEFLQNPAAWFVQKEHPSLDGG